MKILEVTDDRFKKYGKVWGLESEKIRREMRHTPLPKEVIYVPSVDILESVDEVEAYRNKVFGGMPIQVGYCNGNNYKLNGLEYHRGSEINIAVTDMILLLGWLPDVEENYTYDTSKVEAFLVPAGTAVELYGTTLHYAPCNVERSGFRCVVILPRRTNLDITFPVGDEGEDKLLMAKNKWLIAHEEAKIDGAFNGLYGENITVEG